MKRRGGIFSRLNVGMKGFWFKLYGRCYLNFFIQVFLVDFLQCSTVNLVQGLC